MQIRPLVPEDAAQVAPLCGQLSYASTAEQVEARLRRIALTPTDAALGAFAPDGQLLGWVHVQERALLEAEVFAEVCSLVVDEQVRGRGVGGALMAACEAWALARGLGRMRVRSNVKRTRAHAFYERLGYAVTKSQHVFQRLLAG